MTYETLLEELNRRADPAYRAFHTKLLKDERIRLIGVRTPLLRALAKEHRGELKTFLAFPDEYYEVTFLKCAIASLLPFDELLYDIDRIVPLIDNWATCDCFAPRCIAEERERFLPYLERYFGAGLFPRRFALTTLLHFYVDRQYLPYLFEKISSLRDEPYYVEMAGAWLLCELLVRFYPETVRFLSETELDMRVRRKGIQKARESLRLTAEQKSALAKFKK